MDRRTFIQSLPALAAIINSCAKLPATPRILLRSSWQIINIGDIAHTPGILALLEKHLPEAEVRLWPRDVSGGVKEMLQARFPNMIIVEAEEHVQQAIRECDFLLHGSGPFLMGERAIKRWREETDKPYGVFGITVKEMDDALRNHLTNAAFVFFRDSVSLQFAHDNGVRCPVMEFGPDAAFATDLRNDKAAENFLSANGLEPGKFVCCIPRYRHTPSWLIKAYRKFDPAKDRRNQEMKEHDHAPLREAIAEVVNETNLKVLICPEDMTHMTIGKEMIYDKLPKKIKQRVVLRRSYWLTDEALSTYVRSVGLFGLDMHSPIMCIGNDIPAIVCRFKEQTSKGIMWQDIGLDEWLFDMDKPKQVEQLVPTVLDMVKNHEAAKAKAIEARKRVETLQKGMVTQLAYFV